MVVDIEEPRVLGSLSYVGRNRAPAFRMAINICKTDKRYLIPGRLARGSSRNAPEFRTIWSQEFDGGVRVGSSTYDHRSGSYEDNCKLATELTIEVAYQMHRD